LSNTASSLEPKLRSGKRAGGTSDVGMPNSARTVIYQGTDTIFGFWLWALAIFSNLVLG